MSKIELGCTVEDRITGFRGVVSGLVQYLTGCNQALVVPRVTAEGAFREPQWFDVDRLDRVQGVDVLQLETTTAGSDLTPPIR